MSREVARLAGHLKDLMDDASSEDGVYPVPIVTASTLRALVRMPEMLSALRVPGVHRMEHYENKSFEELRYEGYAGNPLSPSSDEHSLLQLMEHVEGALFLDAPMLLKHNQSVIASRVNGKNTDELRALLGAGCDFDSAELEAALAESAFLPEGYEAPQQLGAASSTAPLVPLRQPSLLGVPATTDAREAALEMVDVATLCELKGVNRFWRALSRHALCSRLCRGRGQPAPTHLEEITDLDVELLIEAGRPGDAALAGRMLSGLARLHGYGCVVDVAKVRAANLGVQEANHFGGEPYSSAKVIPPPSYRPRGAARGDGGSFLRGAAKAALDRCISGDREAPLKLTIAAVACAGSGVACGIPVQHMREDTMPVLDLCNKGLRGPAVMLISYLFPAMGVLTMANLLGNEFDAESAKMLAEVAKQKGISLCGIQRDQTTADFSNRDLKPPDAILLASDLSQAGVTGALTKLSLAKNKLGEEGTKFLCDALVGNNTLNTLKELDLSGEHTYYKGTVSNIGGTAGAKHVANMLLINGGLTSIDLSGNQLCGILEQGTYTAEGITAIADAMRVNGALTKMSLADNTLGEEGTKAICEALEQNKTLKQLDISGTPPGCGGIIGGGSAGAKHVAKMLGINGTLTALDLSFIYLEDEGVSTVCEAIQNNKETKLASLNFTDNFIGPVGANAVAAMVAVTGGLTSINLSNNQLCGVWTDFQGQHGTYTAEGITAIADAMRVNGGLTSIDLSENQLCGIWTDDYGHGSSYIAEGITAIADALRVNGALTVANLLHTKIDAESAEELAEVAKEKGISLCGIRRDQTTADFFNQDLKPPDAILLASDLSQAGVTGALTVANLLGNALDAKSAKMLAEVAKEKGISLCGIQRDQTTTDFSNQNLTLPDAILLASDLSQADVTGGLTSLNLSYNRLCRLNRFFSDGTYTAEGITAIADALRVNGGLTKLSLAEDDELGEEGTKAICEALEQNTTLKELDISGSKIGGSAGAKHVAKMVGVNGGLTSINMSGNNLTDTGRDMTGIKELAAALGVNGALTQVLAF